MTNLCTLVKELTTIIQVIQNLGSFCKLVRFLGPSIVKRDYSVFYISENIIIYNKISNYIITDNIYNLNIHQFSSSLVLDQLVKYT